MTKIYKWQKREAKRQKRNKMIGGKLDSGILTAQSKRIPSGIKNMLFCPSCQDIKRFKNGKCRKCGWRYSNV